MRRHHLAFENERKSLQKILKMITAIPLRLIHRDTVPGGGGGGGVLCKFLGGGVPLEL